MRPRPFSPRVATAGRSPPRPPTTTTTTAASRSHIDRLVERAAARELSSSWRSGEPRMGALHSLTPSLAVTLSRVELKAARYGVQVEAWAKARVASGFLWTR